ncbi:hypothetical protein GWJ07_11635 [Proteus sp. G2639]|nr:hypothetical protein [Proteus sp. G2639]
MIHERCTFLALVLPKILYRKKTLPVTICVKESCGVKFKETQYIGVSSNGDNKIKVIARLIKCTNLIVSVDK